MLGWLIDGRNGMQGLNFTCNFEAYSRITKCSLAGKCENFSFIFIVRLEPGLGLGIGMSSCWGSSGYESSGWGWGTWARSAWAGAGEALTRRARAVRSSGWSRKLGGGTLKKSTPSLKKPK